MFLPLPETLRPLGDLVYNLRWTWNQKTRELFRSLDPELFDTSTATDAIYSQRDGGVVSSIPFSMLGPTHDRVLIQLVRAPSGTLVLNAAGFTGVGTRAAAHYFVNTLAPTYATLMTRWYVLDWDDTDASGAPSAGDTFTVISSGP